VDRKALEESFLSRAARHALAHGFNWQVVEDSIGLVCCSWVSWWGGQIERREELFLGAACVLCSLFCSTISTLHFQLLPCT